MKKKLLVGLTTGLFLVGMVGGAYATPLAYNESIDGDLFFNILNLDVGVNTVNGTSSKDPSDLDNFYINVGSNMSLTSITFEALSLNYYDNNTSNGIYATITNYFSQNSTQIGNTLVDLTTTSPVDLIPLSLPLSDGQYTINTSISSYDGDSWELDYKYTFNVAMAPVPEPATMLLFGTGLAGLAGSRLRRKKKA